MGDDGCLSGVAQGVYGRAIGFRRWLKGWQQADMKARGSREHAIRR
jgi:hypothetical protein